MRLRHLFFGDGVLVGGAEGASAAIAAAWSPKKIGCSGLCKGSGLSRRSSAAAAAATLLQPPDAWTESKRIAEGGTRSKEGYNRAAAPAHLAADRISSVDKPTETGDRNGAPGS